MFGHGSMGVVIMTVVSSVAVGEGVLLGNGLGDGGVFVRNGFAVGVTGVLLGVGVLVAVGEGPGLGV